MIINGYEIPNNVGVKVTLYRKFGDKLKTMPQIILTWGDLARVVLTNAPGYNFKKISNFEYDFKKMLIESIDLSAPINRPMLEKNINEVLRNILDGNEDKRY